jgi:hypothetical protein
MSAFAAPRKAMSNPASCTTSGASPTKAKGSSAIAANNGLSAKNSAVRPCIATASAGMSGCGHPYRRNVWPVGELLTSLPPNVDHVIIV